MSSKFLDLSIDEVNRLACKEYAEGRGTGEYARMLVDRYYELEAQGYCLGYGDDDQIED